MVAAFSNVKVVHLLIFLLAFGEDAAYDSVLGDRRKIHGTFREFVLPLVWKSRETSNAFVGVDRGCLELRYHDDQARQGGDCRDFCW